MPTDVIHGSAFALARWFQPAHPVNGSADDEERERILNEVSNATHVALRKTDTGETEVLVKTPGGACMIETADSPAALVMFDFVEDTNWRRTKFWMNASSVATLGDKLREVPRADFNDLFFGAVV